MKSAGIRQKPGAGRRSAKSAGPGRTPLSRKNKKPGKEKREESKAKTKDRGDNFDKPLARFTYK